MAPERARPEVERLDIKRGELSSTSEEDDDDEGGNAAGRSAGSPTHRVQYAAGRSAGSPTHRVRYERSTSKASEQPVPDAGGAPMQAGVVAGKGNGVGKGASIQGAGKSHRKPKKQLSYDAQRYEEPMTPRSAQLAAQTSQLVERALDGATSLVSRHQFADEGEKETSSHSRQLLNDTIDQCYRRLDGSVGRLLVEPRMEVSAESLFKAIDVIRKLETTPAETVQEQQLVSAVLRLVAIVTKLCETSRKERSVAHTLHKAARKGDKAELLRLLGKGVDVNIADNAGHTALMEACQYHHTSCVELLLSRGADVSRTTSLGWSALKFAALDGDANLPCLKLLLDARPELETRSEGGLYGNTVLHNAAESGYPGVVEALLAAGCSSELKNADGKTPLDLAIAHKKYDAARIFNLDAGDHCQVVAQTASCGSAAVAGWLRWSGATDETVEAFEKAGVTGKDLVWMRQLDPSLGITDPEQVQLIMQALDGLPARRDASLWRRGKRGVTFVLSCVTVVVFLACAYWYTFFFGYTVAQTWNDLVGQYQG